MQWAEIERVAAMDDPTPVHRNGTAPTTDDGFRLTRLADLLAEPEEAVTSLVAGLMPMGGLVFVAAKPKVGKSTLVRNLALAVARGGEFLGRRCARGTVIYLALEERRAEVRRHFREMGAVDDDVLVHVAKAPADGLRALNELIESYKPVLVIIDPLLRFTRVRDEKAYAELSNALEGVMSTARDRNVCIVATHHAPKSAATEAVDALLGSTAISGAPDTIMVLRQRDNERTAETVQRYGEDMPRSVVTLDKITGLVTVAGTVAETRRADTHAQVMRLFTTSGAELTTSEIVGALDARKADVLDALTALSDAGRLVRGGAGKPRDPFRYTVPTPLAGTEEPTGEMAANPFSGTANVGSQDSSSVAVTSAEALAL